MATPEADTAFGVPTVSVSGHGSVNVPPDTASVTIGVDVIKRTLDEAQETATVQATAVIEALKDAGISAEDIRTSQFNVNILRDNSANANPTAITGFKITNQLRVTVRDIDQLGELLEAAVSAGANSIYGIGFFVDDRTAATSEARIAAVEDARIKAEELASAAGMTLGPVVAMSEGVAPITYGMAGGGAGGAGGGAVPVEPGAAPVAVDVTMVFALR
jgi:uncharacterized protein YggE